METETKETSFERMYLDHLKMHGVSLFGFEHNETLPFRCGTLLYVHIEKLIGCKSLNDMSNILAGESFMAAAYTEQGDMALKTDDLVEALSFGIYHAPDRGKAFIFDKDRTKLITIDCT